LALSAIPSAAIAANSPTNRRAALRTGIKTSLEIVHCVLGFSCRLSH
jgi:hypothetical protein